MITKEEEDFNEFLESITFVDDEGNTLPVELEDDPDQGED